MTEGVKMEPGSIAVAGLTVTVSSDITPVVRQANNIFNFQGAQGVGNNQNAPSGGETSFIDSPRLEVSQEQANFLTVPAGTDLRKIQETFNALKLKPTSIISVFQAMHDAGMIHADIVVLPR
jgi:flagellar basal body P-ring protein FlgI